MVVLDSRAAAVQLARNASPYVVQAPHCTGRVIVTHPDKLVSPGTTTISTRADNHQEAWRDPAQNIDCLSALSCAHVDLDTLGEFCQEILHR